MCVNIIKFHLQSEGKFIFYPKTFYSSILVINHVKEFVRKCQQALLGKLKQTLALSSPEAGWVLRTRTNDDSTTPKSPSRLQKREAQY